MLCTLILIYELSSYEVTKKHMFFLKSEGMVCLKRVWKRLNFLPVAYIQ